MVVEEFEVVVSSYMDSEHGSDEERRIWQLIGTFEGVRVQRLLRLVLIESWSDALEKDAAM